MNDAADDVSTAESAAAESAADVRTVEAIVPSLRVDVLGARAFKVSRAYFAKGVAAGRVSVDDVAAGKATSVAAGQLVVARGLGSFRLASVDGETRKENLKVTLLVSKTPAG